MADASSLVERREKLMPIVARAFSELGYHRATTAEIARRCKVRENILYRLWDDKKAMFIAALHHVHDLAIATWTRHGRLRGGGFSFARALQYESRHVGEFGNYRILFSALGEPDDPEIREALVQVYDGFHRFITKKLRNERSASGGNAAERAEQAAWTLIGMGTMSTILRELHLATGKGRELLVSGIGRKLMVGP